MRSTIDVTVVNLGSDQEVYLSSVASLIAKITGDISRVRFTAAGAFQEPGLPDLSKAKQLLSWIPLVRLEDGVRRMVDDARSRRQQRTMFS